MFRLKYLHGKYFNSKTSILVNCRSQWPCGLRGGSMATRLLALWVRIAPGTWMFVCYDFCVLSGRDLSNGLITRAEESCLLWCVWVWSWILDNEEALAHWGCCAMVKRYIPIKNIEFSHIKNLHTDLGQGTHLLPPLDYLQFFVRQHFRNTVILFIL